LITLDFSGKAVLVTGGSSGIGNGIAGAFRDAGAAVTITGTRAAGDYVSDLVDMDYHQVDVADDGAMRRLAETVGRLDVLINNAGTVVYRGAEFEIDTFRRVLDVNLAGAMHGATLFRDKLGAAGGTIINIVSLAAFHATRGNPAYGASKGALAQLTKSLAVAFARDGIRVNAIAPGYVETKITQVSKQNPAIDAAIVERTPMRRWGTPADMAGAALFLASPLAGFVTGQTLVVDGGYSLGI
jgi:3-oxoacyl-[acyl-carrier protein] reductase